MLARLCSCVVGAVLLLLASGAHAEPPPEPCGHASISPACGRSAADARPTTPPARVKDGGALPAPERPDHDPDRPTPSPRRTKPDSVGLGPRRPSAGSRALDRSLVDGMLERERSLRLGRGALLSAAEATEVRKELPSGEATATIAVDVDAAGAAQVVTLLSSTAHGDAWARVARAMAAELAGRPTGAHFGPDGERILLRIELRERYPSGHAKLVEVIGARLIFDVADFGSRKRRQVHAWIVDEPAAPTARGTVRAGDAPAPSFRVPRGTPAATLPGPGARPSSEARTAPSGDAPVIAPEAARTTP